MARIDSRNSTTPNAPTTGNMTWLIWNGRLQPPMRDTLISHRLGSDGDDVETFGLRAKPSTIRLMSFATSADALAQAVADVTALQGTTVSCRDALGRTWSSVVIERVTILRDKPTKSGHATRSAGGLRATSHVLEVEMVMRAQPDSGA